MYADFQCKTCGQIDLVGKSYDFEKSKYSDFPKEVSCSCGGKKVRMFSPPVIDVCEGFLGNAKNGYSSRSATYIPSKYSPMNSVYGKYGRTAGVEVENG